MTSRTCLSTCQAEGGCPVCRAEEHPFLVPCKIAQGSHPRNTCCHPEPAPADEWDVRRQMEALPDPREPAPAPPEPTDEQCIHRTAHRCLRRAGHNGLHDMASVVPAPLPSQHSRDVEPPTIEHLFDLANAIACAAEDAEPPLPPLSSKQFLETRRVAHGYLCDAAGIKRPEWLGERPRDVEPDPEWLADAVIASAFTHEGRVVGFERGRVVAALRAALSERPGPAKKEKR